MKEKYLVEISIYIRGVESFTISTINFSIQGSNKRFFDKLYESSITGNILQFFLYLDNTDDFRLTENDIDTKSDF